MEDMSMRYWIVQAQIVRDRRTWRESMGVPTFLLDTWIQGLVGEEQVRQFAEKMLGDISNCGNIFVSVAPCDSDLQPRGNKPE